MAAQLARLPGSVSRNVIAELRRRLAERESPLAKEGAIDAGLEIQARSILSETYRAVVAGASHSAEPVSVEYGSLPELEEHGRLSAMREVDPAEALMAGELLFHVALPPMVDALAAVVGKESASAVAHALHHSIWRRFPPGAIAYVAVLRSRLAGAYGDARRRVARDLHDRVSHELVSAIQQLETEMLDLGPRDRLVSAIASVREVVEATQSLAFDLRQVVGDRGLELALAEYAQSPDHGNLPVTFQADGVASALPQQLAEEILAIVVEAVRNAQAHACGATVVAIRLRWTTAALLVTVEDNGQTPAVGPSHRSSLGVQGMIERAHSVGAHLSTSTPGGRLIILTVPFSHGAQLG